MGEDNGACSFHSKELPSDIRKKPDDDNTRLTNHRQFAFPSPARLKPRVIPLQAS